MKFIISESQKKKISENFFFDKNKILILEIGGLSIFYRNAIMNLGAKQVSQMVSRSISTNLQNIINNPVNQKNWSKTVQNMNNNQIVEIWLNMNISSIFDTVITKQLPQLSIENRQDRVIKLYNGLINSRNPTEKFPSILKSIDEQNVISSLNPGDEVAKIIDKQYNFLLRTEFEELLKTQNPTFYNRIKNPSVQFSEIDGAPDWILKNWVTTDKPGNLQKLRNKVDKLKNLTFDPSKIKVINRTILRSWEGKGGTSLRQRETIDILLPTNDRIIVYQSSGTGAPELKQEGDWQVINGFMTSKSRPGYITHFVKDEASTQLTKGGNQYLTELDKFLKINGVEGLGKTGVVSQLINGPKSGSEMSSIFLELNSHLIDWQYLGTNSYQYNKEIAKALQTDDYSKIKPGGFERLGIPDFRNFLRTRMDFSKKLIADPNNGFWRFIVK